MMEENWLDKLKVGDKVIAYHKYTSAFKTEQSVRHISKVVKITKLRIIIKDGWAIHYRKSGGGPWEGHYKDNDPFDWIEPWSKQAERRADILNDIYKEDALEKVSLETLEVVYRAIKDGLK